MKRVRFESWMVLALGLGAILITGDRGHVLIDGALPESAPLIQENIRALGLRVEDVELILNSHVHFDHAGGLAALQKASGAVVAASPKSAPVLERGTLKGSRALRTLLADLGDMVAREAVKSPAIIVVGEVVVLSDAENRLGALAARAEALA